MTISLKGGELVLDAIVTKLQANLPGRIAAVNQAHDDFNLAVPLTKSYFVGKVQQVPVAPAMFVISDAINFKTTEGTHALSFDMDVCVYVLESAQTGPELERRMLRQAKCVIEALWDDTPMEALTGSAYRIVPKRARPGTPFNPSGRNRDTWRQFYCLVFTAQQFDSD